MTDEEKLSEEEYKLLEEVIKPIYYNAIQNDDSFAKYGVECYLAGCNKANEWHYMKDGDLPKETGLLMSKALLLVTKMKGSDCLSLALGKYNFSTQEFSYQHIVGLTDVIAWKEIVPPEL